MKLQTKLTLLIVFFVLAFISLANHNKGMEQDRLNSIFRAEETAWNTAFDKTLDLVQHTLETFAYDYTYWDEMIGFLRTGDRKWAKTNIDQSLGTYKANAAWICSKDRSLFYVTSDTGDDSLEKLPISWAAIGDLFAKSRFCHFYAKTPKGLIEIRGATIHPSSDAARVTEPAGYLFVGRLWDDKYLADLADLTGMSVSLTSIARSGGLRYVSDPQKGFISSSRALKNWEGVSMMRLNILKESESIKAFSRATHRMMIVIVLYSVVLFVVLLISFTFWINIPLNNIKKAVLDKKPITDKSLLSEGNEFSALALMMNRFFEQRERLISEMVGHRKAESQLRLSEEKFAKAFRVNPNPMAIFMRDNGRFLDANDVFSSLTGYSRAKIMEHTLEELNILLPERRLAVLDILKKENRLNDVDLDIRTASGETRNWLFSASTIEVGKDRIILAVANDITERKKAESDLDMAQQQLVQSEKLAALGRFASGLAHEVKNPLGILLGGLEYLKAKMPEADPDVREALTKMREAVMRANIIVKDMLSFAKPSKVIFEKVHPNTLVHDAVAFVELFKHKSDTADIELKQELTGEDMYVEVDKNQIQQALFNIFLNAIEAMGMSGEIVVRTSRCGDACLIEVEDNGEGIAQADLSRLFEPFFTTKRELKGTGLGLPIVKAIIERHKGTISIESKLGKGTKVSIMLPIVEA